MADDATRDEDVTDALPDDLNASEWVGPYVFPNNNRRRVPGYLYLALGAAVHRRLGDRRARRRAGERRLPRSPASCWCCSAPTTCVAGWNLDVDERDALVAATKEVGFAVGHASAQLGWRGLRSRPTWRILLYSAEEPPQKRGLVLVDGVDGEIVAHFVEDNPEDWSDLRPRRLRWSEVDRTTSGAASVPIDPGHGSYRRSWMASLLIRRRLIRPARAAAGDAVSAVTRAARVDASARGSDRHDRRDGCARSAARDVGPSPVGPRPRALATGAGDRQPARPVEHHMTGSHHRGYGADWFGIAPHGYATSHLDALCHIFWDGQVYGGRPADVVTAHGATKLGVHTLRDGIVARGVLLDIPAALGVDALEPGTAITVEDLEAAEAACRRAGRHRRRAPRAHRPVAVARASTGRRDPREQLAGLHASCLPVAARARDRAARQRRRVRCLPVARRRRAPPDPHRRHRGDGPPPPRQPRPRCARRAAVSRRAGVPPPAAPSASGGTAVAVNRIATHEQAERVRVGRRPRGAWPRPP